MKLRVSTLIILITLSIVISGCGGGGGGGTIPSIPPDNTPTNPPQVTATPTPVVYGNVTGTVLLSGGIPLNSGYVVIKSYVANEKTEKDVITEIQASSYTRNTLTDSNGNFGFSNFPQGSARIEAWQNQSSFLSDPNNPIAAMNTTVVLNTTGIILQQGTVEPTPMPTAVPTPTNTPLPGSTPTNTPTNTPTSPPGSTPTFTPTPTSTNTPTATPTSKSVSINVKDIFDNSNKSGAQVYYNNNLVGSTDASGNCSFNISGDGRVKITGTLVERSFPIYSATSSYNATTVSNTYNSIFLRGIFGNMQIRKWSTKPTFIIYKYLLNSSPAVAVSQATIDNIKSVIQNDIATMANGFFSGAIIEEYNGRPDDDTRFAMIDSEFGMIQTNGYISVACRQSITGGSGSSYTASTGNTLNYAGLLFETTPTLSTIRHELGHSLFDWEHPFDFMADANNEMSIMNYSSTGKRTTVFSPKDIDAAKFWASRPPGNNTPDLDPDGSTFKLSEIVVIKKHIDP